MTIYKDVIVTSITPGRVQNSKGVEFLFVVEVTSLKSLWEVLSSKEFKVTRSDVKSERSSFPRASVV